MPSPRRAVAPLALVLVAVSAAPANATIVPQDNIAGVKIDMTQEKVLEVLGSPATTITRRGGGCACVPVTTYTYKRRGIKVFFKPNRANTANITFAIEVYRDRGQRTAEGIGIGSPRSAVKREIEGVKCRRLDPTYAFCLVGSGRLHRVSTSFRLDRRNKVESVVMSRPWDH
jgi:hypothetical protein